MLSAMPVRKTITGDSRQRLLDAARELIWRSSYASVSVDDICQTAKVNKGSFYHFFPSKAELAAASFDDYWEQRGRPFHDRTFSPQVPPLQRIASYAQALVEVQTKLRTEHGCVLGCPYSSVGSELATQDAGLRELAAESLRRVRTYLVSAVRDGQRDGGIPAGDADRLAADLHAFILGVILQAKVANDLGAFADLPERCLRLLGAAEPAATR